MTSGAPQPDSYEFKAITGQSRPPNPRFYGSLTGFAQYKATAANWVAVVLPDEVEITAAVVNVSVRLLTFIFIPGACFTDAVDDGEVSLFPLPLPLSSFLKELLKRGMPFDPLPGPRAAQQLVVTYAAVIPRPMRTFGVDDIRITSSVGSTLEGITPSLLRSDDADNVALAELLSLLPGYCVDLTSGKMPSALALLLPPSAASSDPVELRAVKVVTAHRDSRPEPPFDELTPYPKVIAELMRRRNDTEEGRFTPLFDTWWSKVYPTLTSAFPAINTAWLMKRTIQTLAQSAGITLKFTPAGLDGLCISAKSLLRQLEADAPAASSDTEARVLSLVKLIQRASVATSKDSDKLEGEEKFDALLAIPEYSDLFHLITALNTSTFVASDASRVVLKHPHPAGHIILATARHMPQTAWTSVMSMRQKSSWQSIFDRDLAVDRYSQVHLDWGCLMPLRGDVPVHAQWLVMGKLDAIPDWWSMLLPWTRKYHGEHVISLPTYAATSDPLDFWLSPDRLRLVEPALTTVFSAIAHGQSRSTAHSFREWFALQLDRSVQLHHIPSGTLIHASLLQDTRSAITLLFSNFSEAMATMFTRPFHEARRPLFNPPGGAAAAFLEIDGEIRATMKQWDQALKGQAAHQALHLQPALNFGGSGQGSSSDLSTVGSGVSLYSGLGHSASQVGSDTHSVLSFGSALSLGKKTAKKTALVVGKGKWPANVFNDWGHAAAHLGIWMKGDEIIWGGVKVSVAKPVTFKPGMCMAGAAPSNNEKGRSKWCVDVLGCKALGYAAHQRPHGSANEDFVCTDVEEGFDKSGWKLIMPVREELLGVAKPAPPWDLRSGPTGDWRLPAPSPKRQRDDDRQRGGDLRNKLDKKRFDRLPEGSKSGEEAGTPSAASSRCSHLHPLSMAAQAHPWLLKSSHSGCQSPPLSGW